MAEKRRGLGRGLGALIPSAPAEEILETPQPEAEERESSPVRGSDISKKQGGRPVDLFFERVTEDDVADQPRSYSSALRSGINKNVLDAQTKRVSKTTGRKSPLKREDAKASPPQSASSEPQATHAEPAATSSAVSGEEATPATASRAQDSSARSGAADGAQSAPSAPAPALSGEQPAEQEAESRPNEATREDVPRGSDENSKDLQAATNPVSNEASRDTSGDISVGETDEENARSGDDQSALVEVPGATFAELPVGGIHPNRRQPRVEFNEDELAELVHSIREIGVLQPVVVRPSQEGGEAKYELVMGERRWRASREAGMETIPAIIRSTLDDDLLRDALLENLHRSALNPLEEAAAYQQLLEDFGCSHDELAGRLGRSRPQISNTIRLMKLPPLVQRRVAAGVLSAGHARALLGLTDAAEMEKLAQRIVAEGLSVRSTEEIVALAGGLRRPSKAASPRDGARHERLDYLATSLSDRLDTNVKITLGAKKGRVSIEFASVDDLNRIIGVLSPTSD